jgi:hypothetical protein
MNKILFTLLAALGGIAGFGVWHVIAAEPPAKTASIDDYSVASCTRCHGKGDPEDFKKFGSEKFILLDESKTWKAHDPHGKAFDVLNPAKSVYAAKMASNEKLKTKYGDLTKAAACLACHAMDVKPNEPLDKKEYVADAEEGINCLGCHGTMKAWQKDHYDNPKAWRVIPPDDAKKGGMKNLRDPHTKAALCSSCHIGNADEGKVVTHEMYAAGHPPLLPFELARFMSAEPQHWGDPFDKKLEYFKDLDPKLAVDVFSYHKSEGAEGFTARNVAISAIESLAAEIKLMAKDAAKASGPLDYARFDCYACHHNLELDSDRQKRGYFDHAPGRPPLKAWNGALASVVAEHATKLGNAEVAKLAGQFPELWKATQAAACAKPFGDAAALKPATAALITWCDAFQKALKSGAVYSPEEAKKLQSMLGAAAVNDKNFADPEAVMAILWAYRSLDQAYGGDAKKWEAVDKLLPATVREESQMKGDKPVTVGELYKARMDKFNAYKSAAFKAAFPQK